MALSGSRRGGGRLEALDTAALRAESTSLLRPREPRRRRGADAGSATHVDYSGDVDEDRSAAQDAAADQGLSA